MRVDELMAADPISIGPDDDLDEAMRRMDENDVRHLPVVEGERVVGVLSERDLLEATGWLPPRVREVLEAPTGDVADFMRKPVVSVSPQDTIVTAAIRLTEWGIGCTPVLDDGRLVGMVSEVDVMDAYARTCRAKTLAIEADPPVVEIMTTDVECVAPDCPAEDALARCRSLGVRHMPVVLDGRLVGVLSDRDLRTAIGRGQLEGTPVSELVADRTVTVTAEQRVSEAAQAMVGRRIGVVPVLEDATLLGLVSSADVVAYCIQAFGSRGGAK